MPLIPDVPPSAVLARCHDKETGARYNVGVWLYDVAKDEWVVPDDAYVSNSRADLGRAEQGGIAAGDGLSCVKLGLLAECDANACRDAHLDTHRSADA